MILWITAIGLALLVGLVIGRLTAVRVDPSPSGEQGLTAPKRRSKWSAGKRRVCASICG